jgi:hypothetical protein
MPGSWYRTKAAECLSYARFAAPAKRAQLEIDATHWLVLADHADGPEARINDFQKPD